MQDTTEENAKRANDLGTMQGRSGLIYEFKLTIPKRNQIRIFAKKKGDTFYLLNGGLKKDDKKFYNVELPKAEKHIKDYIL